MNFKMYFLVLYNLSPIQQGIQSGHCAIEYMLKYGNRQNTKQRASNDKTFIILNGGTTYTLDKHIEYLNKLDINIATFQEPDLGGITTCVCFLAKYGSDITKYFTSLFKLA